MGFFSSSEPLSAQFEEALDVYFSEEYVGRKQYRTGISKLEASQEGILSALSDGERLINIAPSVTGAKGYSGHLILTNKRVIEYKGRVRKSIPIDEVVDVGMGAHPGGFVVFEVISVTARDYAAFADSPETDAGIKYYQNIIQLYLDDPKLARHAASLITGEAGRARC